MLGLEQTLRALDVNLSKELKALNLPKERPRIVPPPASFQKMVDELGLHTVLQPECPKLFKDGHVNECARKALEKYGEFRHRKEFDGERVQRNRARGENRRHCHKARQGPTRRLQVSVDGRDV